MNILTGEIIEINTSGSMSVVRIQVSDIVLTSIIIDTPETCDYLRTGNKINVLFKETEVSIAKLFSGMLSIQNQVPCKIKTVNPGALLCQVSMSFHDLEIVSIITRNACEQLKLMPGDVVLALIKTNEISLSAHD